MTIQLNCDGLTPELREEIVQAQREWAERVAQGIERGELPTASDERGLLAEIVRKFAAQLSAKPAKAARRGNPGKLPSDDSVALQVGFYMAVGDPSKDKPSENKLNFSQAVDRVAGFYGVESSTVAKNFRPRREAVAAYFRSGQHDERDIAAILGNYYEE